MTNIDPKHLTGLHPDLHDPRDRPYVPSVRAKRRRARRVDLRPLFPPVYHQGRLNACSANAIAGAMWFDAARDRPGTPSPSRLFIYYLERAREGLRFENAPVSLRDGYRTVARAGACTESMWPYRTARFARRPPRRCFAQAGSYRVVRYQRIEQRLSHLKACLHEGDPWTFGFSVYARFIGRKVKATGRVPMPARGEKLVGGHAMLAVGFDDRERAFIVRNSFGRAWGIDGYCLMPYDYLLHPRLSWDFWTARHVGPGRRHR